MHQRIRLLATLYITIGLVLATCGSGGATTATSTASPDEDHLATAHALLLTQGPNSTTKPPMPTPTTQPTSTGSSPSLSPIPEIDLDIDLPYLQDGGALPPGAMARIGIGEIVAAEVYPDRSAILLGTSTGLYVYRLDTFERIWRKYLERPLSNVSLSGDGSRIVIEFGSNFTPLLYDAQTGDRLTNLPGWHETQWAPDGRLLAMEAVPGSYDQTFGWIRIYDSSSGQPLRTVEAPISSFWGAVFSVIRWSPDGKYLAACGDEAVFIWDTSTGEIVYTINADSTTGGLYLRYCAMQFSPDGKYLGIHDSEHTVVVDMTSGEDVFEPDDAVYGARWTSDSLYLAYKDSLKVFDVSTWSLRYQREENVEDFAVSPDGKYLALAGSNVTVLDTASFDIEYTIPLLAYNSVSWSPDGRWLIQYDVDIFDFGKDEYTFFDEGKASGSLKVQNWMAFIDDQTVLAVDGYRVMLVDLPTNKISSGVCTGLEVGHLGWSQDGNTLVLSTPDGDWYWSESSGQVGPALPDSTTFIPATQPEGVTFFTEGAEPEIPLNLTSPDGKFRAAITDLHYGDFDGAWGSASGIFSGQVGIFENNSEYPFKTLTFSGPGPTALAWSADSRLLAIGLGSAFKSIHNSRVIVLDVHTGQELFSLEGHLSDIMHLAFSPNGMRLASASDDGTVIVWNTGH
ncbi:MAG: hypothetical protein JXB07_00545 [Anaerolineae bacterium]|nr:hypothetical protein [Anaerolineae bacterium]